MNCSKQYPRVEYVTQGKKCGKTNIKCYATEKDKQRGRKNSPSGRFVDIDRTKSWCWSFLVFEIVFEENILNGFMEFHGIESNLKFK